MYTYTRFIVISHSQRTPFEGFEFAFLKNVVQKTTFPDTFLGLQLVINSINYNQIILTIFRI